MNVFVFIGPLALCSHFEKHCAQSVAEHSLLHFLQGMSGGNDGDCTCAPPDRSPSRENRRKCRSNFSCPLSGIAGVQDDENFIRLAVRDDWAKYMRIDCIEGC